MSELAIHPVYLVQDDEIETIPATFMSAMVESQYRQKREGWTDERVRTWFSLNEYPGELYLGSFSRTSVPDKRRWLSQSHVKNFGYGWLTPPEASRLYLSVKYKDRSRRLTTRQYRELVHAHKSPPLAALPCEIEDACYVDLVAAYWTIVQSVGWDVDYSPQRFLGIRSRNDDFPFPKWKPARNCLVSAGLPTKLRIWKAGKLRIEEKRNPLINMILWGLCMDVLNGVACDMIEAGAVYVHTDGYIIPATSLPLAFEVAHSWGMSLSVKGQGRAVVRSVGEYTIEGYRANFARQTRSRKLLKVYDPGRAWLRPRMQRARFLTPVNSDFA